MHKTITATNNVKQIMYCNIYTPFHRGVRTTAAIPLLILLYHSGCENATIFSKNKKSFAKLQKHY